MFGYVRAQRDTLTAEALEKYDGVYCGLCHVMGKRYGHFSRLFLNYDFIFLAMVLAPAECPSQCRRCRCLLHPVEGRPACTEGEWLERAAGESVVLAYWKLRDAIWDEGFFSRMWARFLCFCLKGGYRRARQEHPEFDQRVQENLEELRRLEGEGCSSMDRMADLFAGILCAAAPQTGDAARDRVVEQLLYQLGRWIYLIDGVDDLSEDRKAERYNPVSARFPEWTEEERGYLRGNLNHSLSLVGSAFQLLPATPWTEVMENIIYSGLPGVQELVFSGRWREAQKRHRRNDL